MKQKWELDEYDKEFLIENITTLEDFKIMLGGIGNFIRMFSDDNVLDFNTQMEFVKIFGLCVVKLQEHTFKNGKIVKKGYSIFEDKEIQNFETSLEGACMEVMMNDSHCADHRWYRGDILYEKYKDKKFVYNNEGDIMLFVRQNFSKEMNNGS